MIRKENILENLMIFINYEKICTKHFSKVPNRKKISNEQFHICEADIYLKRRSFSYELPPILLDIFDTFNKLKSYLLF